MPNVGHNTSNRSREIGYHLTGELLDFLLHVFPCGFGIGTVHY
jgi:hypothetical protein